MNGKDYEKPTAFAFVVEWLRVAFFALTIWGILTWDTGAGQVAAISGAVLASGVSLFIPEIRRQWFPSVEEEAEMKRDGEWSPRWLARYYYSYRIPEGPLSIVVPRTLVLMGLVGMLVAIPTTWD